MLRLAVDKTESSNVAHLLINGCIASGISIGKVIMRQTTTRGKLVDIPEDAAQRNLRMGLTVHTYGRCQ
jgi:hypothetical protein